MEGRVNPMGLGSGEARYWFFLLLIVKRSPKHELTCSAAAVDPPGPPKPLNCGEGLGGVRLGSGGK